jgi:hypothetical protein
VAILPGQSQDQPGHEVILKTHDCGGGAIGTHPHGIAPYLEGVSNGHKGVLGHGNDATTAAVLPNDAVFGAPLLLPQEQIHLLLPDHVEHALEIHVHVVVRHYPNVQLHEPLKEIFDNVRGWEYRCSIIWSKVSTIIPKDSLIVIALPHTGLAFWSFLSAEKSGNKM